MNRRLSLILVIIVMKSISYAQCSLVVTPANPTISCIGGSLRLCALVTNSDIDQSQLLSNAGTSARTLSGYSIFQTFKAGVTGTLTQIDIGFFNYINGSGVLKIYQGDGISGTVLFSQNVSVSCPSGSCLIPFDVGSIPIVAGETYTFHFIPGVGIPDPYGVQSMVPGNYSNGYFGLIDPSGTYDTGFDMIFRTHVQSTVTYLWSNGSTDSCIDISSPGIYNVTITTHPFSCSKSMQVNVTGTTTPPNASAGLDKILDCSHPTIVLDGSSTTSGVTYQWSGPGILNGGSTPNPTVNMAGIYTLTVTQTSTGCANTDIVVVTGTTTPPNASAGLDKILDCSHPTVVLDGSSTTSGVTYQWSGPGILNGGSTPNPTVNMAGTYTLTVTQTSTGCANTDIVVVAESISSLLLTATIQHNNCGTLNIGAIDVTMIGGTPPFKYLWSNGATTEDVSSLPDDVYKLNVIDGVGCDFDTIFSINSSNGLVVKAFTDTVIKMGLPVSLFGSIIMGSPRYIWWEPTTYLSCINCQNPVSFPIEDIDYVFHAVDSNGCEGADTIHIKVEDDIHSIFFPTAFSPDGNNINDQFKALGEQKNIQSFNMRIFNRWGERIFESDDIKIGWDGKYQQEKQEMDIYIYQTEIIYTNQSVSHLSGAFLLLR